MQENIALAPLTTLGIGGRARWFAEINSEADLTTALDFAHTRNLPIFVLGGGSNLLIADAGFSGVVLAIRMCGIEVFEHPDETMLSVAAGENWDEFVSFAVARNLAGIECLAGIPGTVGGTPVQNVGAYGQEVSETIRTVRAFDTHTNQFVSLPHEQCEFSYRRSLFNSTARGRYIVTRVDFALTQNAAPKLAYKDVKQYFESTKTPPTLQQVASGVREIRHRKGMLLVAGEADCRSAGSFFKNPIVTRDRFHAVAESLHLPPDAVPCFPAEAGHVKLSAAWLLDQAGFHKGFHLGRAGISSRHTLALVNLGGATAAEIIALRDRIITTVQEKFSITLEQEPVALGF